MIRFILILVSFVNVLTVVPLSLSWIIAIRLVLSGVSYADIATIVSLVVIPTVLWLVVSLLIYKTIRVS